jgi:hypothetical protein
MVRWNAGAEHVRPSGKRYVPPGQKRTVLSTRDPSARW